MDDFSTATGVQEERVSWDEFMAEIMRGIAGSNQLYHGNQSHPPPLNLSEAHYQKWIQHVADAIVESERGQYPLHDDEQTWAQRSVLEATFVWGARPHTLAFGRGGHPRPPPFEREPFAAWIENVTRWLDDSTEPYVLASGERTWAEQAIKAGVFEWAIEPISIRRHAASAHLGPYR